MEEINTAAGRLLNILLEGKKLANTTNCIDAWNILLKANNDKPLLFKRLGSVMGLSDQIKYELSNAQGIRDPKHYLNWVDSVSNAFTSQNLSAQWSSFIGHINDTTISFLSITNDMIKMSKSEIALEESQLNSFHDDFSNLKAEVEDSDLDTSTKEFILKRLNEILTAFDEYEFQGVVPLVDSIHVSIGQIVMTPNLVKEVQEKTVFQKFWNVLVNTSVVITLATGAPQIANDLKAALPLIEQIKVEDNSDDLKEEKIIDVETIKEDVRIV